MSELVSEYVEFNVPHNNVGHFGDESFPGNWLHWCWQPNK